MIGGQGQQTKPAQNMIGVLDPRHERRDTFESQSFTSECPEKPGPREDPLEKYSKSVFIQKAKDCQNVCRKLNGKAMIEMESADEPRRNTSFFNAR
jgi:hypothetical protein